MEYRTNIFYLILVNHENKIPKNTYIYSEYTTKYRTTNN